MGINVFVVDAGHSREMKELGFTAVDDPFKADFFQFMGGEDVSPELYGEKNTHSFSNFQRDLREMGWFHLAQKLGKPCVGICRGGQFLNVMCGGKMQQDVGGHTRNHILNVEGFNPCMATSTHHQMMVMGEYGKLIGWGPTKDDVEVVFYDKNKVLCFQPHPEYHPVVMSELSSVYTKLIKTLLL